MMHAGDAVTSCPGGPPIGTNPDRYAALSPDWPSASGDPLDDDELEEVPSHRNDLGDWCPSSGKRTADGTCPQYCHEADVLVDYDAGDRELPYSTDLPEELYEEVDGVKYAVHPLRDVDAGSYDPPRFGELGELSGREV